MQNRNSRTYCIYSEIRLFLTLSNLFCSALKYWNHEYSQKTKNSFQFQCNWFMFVASFAGRKSWKWRWRIGSRKARKGSKIPIHYNKVPMILLAQTNQILCDVFPFISYQNIHYRKWMDKSFNILDGISMDFTLY